MTTTTFDAAAIADFGEYLGAEAYTTLGAIDEFARREGMSKEGFGDAPSLLAPLGEIVSGPAADLVAEGFKEMQRKLCQLGDTVIAAAKQYGTVEVSNESLADQIRLDDDVSDSEVPAVATEHAKGGSSKFTVTELELSDPDRPTADFSSQISDSLAGEVLSFLDWVWTEFDVDDGKSFTGSLIEPLVGNPQSIQANGVAWQSAAGGMGDLAGTMGVNLVELATNDWEGEAAEALKQFATSYWKDGAAWVAKEVGDFIASGFDKVAEVSTNLAKLAIEAIEQIAKLAAKLAARALPILGWAWTAIEAAASWLLWLFGIDIDNLIDDINNIIELAGKVLNLFEAIRNIVETMQDYVNTVQEILTFVQGIPDLASVDPAEIATKVQGLPEKQAAVTAALDEGSKALDEVDQQASEATTSGG